MQEVLNSTVDIISRNHLLSLELWDEALTEFKDRLASQGPNTVFPVETLFKYFPPLSDANRALFYEVYEHLKMSLFPFQVWIYWPYFEKNQQFPHFHNFHFSSSHSLVSKLFKIAVRYKEFSQSLGLEKLDDILSRSIPESMTYQGLELSHLQEVLLNERKINYEMILNWFRLLKTKEEELGLVVLLPPPPKNPSANAEKAREIENYFSRVMVSSLENTAIEKIIDPQKLEGFLTSEIKNMWEKDKIHFQELWEVLEGAPGVDPLMVKELFILFERKIEQFQAYIHFPAEFLVCSEEEKEEILLEIAQNKKYQALQSTSSKERNADPISRELIVSGMETISAKVTQKVDFYVEEEEKKPPFKLLFGVIITLVLIVAGFFVYWFKTKTS